MGDSIEEYTDKVAASLERLLVEARRSGMFAGAAHGHALALADVHNVTVDSGKETFTRDEVFALLDAAQEHRKKGVMMDKEQGKTEPLHPAHPLYAYVKDAMRTESCDFEAIGDRLVGCMGCTKPNVDLLRLLHFTMGLQTEVGELVDQLKKHLFYGKPLDHVNLKEEFGDINWYMAGLADTLDEMGVCTWPEALAANVKKLRARYPDKFTEHNAVNRDLDRETQALKEGE